MLLGGEKKGKRVSRKQRAVSRKREIVDSLFTIYYFPQTSQLHLDVAEARFALCAQVCALYAKYVVFTGQ